MPLSHFSLRLRPRLAVALLIGPMLAAHASVRVLGPAELSSHRVTCDFPVRLTHDCSIWQGATRSIALGDFRMSLAADSAGRTILLSRLRRGPNHNGGRFRPEVGSASTRTQSAQAIDLIDALLGNRGIRLQRMQPVRRGRRVAAYFLQFSDNAYDVLKQFTVLESEHWLPKRRKGR